MGKRDFSAFDRALSTAQPDLAGRIGVQIDPPEAAPLRVVPAPIVDEPEVVTHVADAPRESKSNGKLRGRVVRSDGSEAGRIVVYLPSDIALRLRRHCFDGGHSITEVAGDLLVEAIGARLP